MLVQGYCTLEPAEPDLALNPFFFFSSFFIKKEREKQGGRGIVLTVSILGLLRA